MFNVYGIKHICQTEDRSHINDLNFYLKELEKQEPIKLKVIQDSPFPQGVHTVWFHL